MTVAEAERIDQWVGMRILAAAIKCGGIKTFAADFFGVGHAFGIYFGERWLIDNGIGTPPPPSGFVDEGFSQ